MAAVIKAAIARCRIEPAYRPLISYLGAVFRLEFRFRMLNWRELSDASFPKDYQFHGTNAEWVKQIGNAVPPALAYALAYAAITQNPNIKALDTIDADRLRVAV